MFTKDKRGLFLLFTLIIVFTIFLGGCENQKIDDVDQEQTGKFDNNIFSVRYLDVGNGDCIFINFGDGKVMMIDCAEKSERNQEKIFDMLEEYSVDQIDYLLLTHPDGDHVGNAVSVIEKYKVDKAYLPLVKNYPEIQNYIDIVTLLNQKKIERVTSQKFLSIKGEDYSLLFLSPSPYGMQDSSYNDYLLSTSPTEEESNNLSPIVYLNYKGIRFLFTGDAGASQEKMVLDNNKLGLYDKYLKDDAFSLEEIDFLKVAHHGATGSTSKEFLELVKPKNAVISVGGNNFFGHPSSITISNLLEAREEVNIFRTDRDGSITVFVDKEGKVKINKESQK